MKYKALLHNGPLDFEFAELEMPPCGDDDVILKNLVASICGSDSDTWLNGGEMHYIPAHVEFGHEVVCEVYEVGKNVTDIKVGDRVAPYPILTTTNPRKAGWLGGFSEYIYCNNAKYDYNLWKLDECISDNEAALIEPLSVGIRAADSVEAVETKKVVILGAGMIGFVCAARLASKGVPRESIVFVDKSPLRIDKVKAQGFNAVCTVGGDWKAEVIELTGGAYGSYGPASAADVIFDCAGSIDPSSTEPTLFEQAMKLVKINGKMIAVGVHRQKNDIDMQKLVFGLQHIICGSGANDYHFKEGMRLLASKQFDFESIISHSFKHDDAIEAIKLTCDTSACFKVLIDYRL